MIIHRSPARANEALVTYSNTLAQGEKTHAIGGKLRLRVASVAQHSSAALFLFLSDDMRLRALTLHARFGGLALRFFVAFGGLCVQRIALRAFLNPLSSLWTFFVDN